jgi:hypothetical protein
MVTMPLSWSILELIASAARGAARLQQRTGRAAYGWHATADGTSDAALRPLSARDATAGTASLRGTGESHGSTRGRIAPPWLAGPRKS